jgi:hypothetical protein
VKTGDSITDSQGFLSIRKSSQKLVEHLLTRFRTQKLINTEKSPLGQNLAKGSYEEMEKERHTTWSLDTLTPLGRKTSSRPESLKTASA